MFVMIIARHVSELSLIPVADLVGGGGGAQADAAPKNRMLRPQTH